MLAATILNDLKTKNYSRIHGQLRLTKTAENYSDILIFRDRDLEQQTLHWLQQRSSVKELFQRYKCYDITLNNFSLPQHYPVQILSGIGSACSGKNIFMFFPYVLSQIPLNESDVFGLEFIDVWSNIFRSIVFPIANRVFTKETLVNFLSLQKNLEKTIFLASIYHEVGHRCGPYKVSPHLSPKLKLNSFQVDIMGELSTDSLLIKHLPEFPEVLQFVLLQRLFWFGRKGFRHNPVSADLNSDNDTWIDIEQPQQENVLMRWMKTKILFVDEKFILPEGLQKIFQDVQDIEEVPHFQTPYTYTLINELTGAIQNEK